MGSSVLYDAAEAILGAITAHFAAILDEDEAPAPIALPDRQFVANGPIAFDCEQLTAEVVRLYSGTPGAENTPTKCVMLNCAELRVWLLRCVPATEEGAPIPTAAALDASATAILTDLWELTQALARAGKADALAPVGLIVTGAAPIQPQGKIGGSLVSLQATF